MRVARTWTPYDTALDCNITFSVLVPLHKTL
jgi:hypothetical protein